MAITFPFPNGYRQTWVYRDAKGNLGKLQMYLSIIGTATPNDARTKAINMQPLISALSNAAFQSANGPWSTYGVAQYGANNSNGAYESVIEKAVLVFQDAAGGLHRYQIPAPKVSIFLADKITVDPGNTDVAAFVAAVQNTSAPANAPFFMGRQGVFLANFMGGYFRAAKLRRRANLFVLTPGLTPSEPEE